MFKRIMYGAAALALVIAGVGTPAHAKKTVVALTAQNLSVHDEQGSLGDYYTLTLPLPELKGQELLGAYLEFYVDVDARTIDNVTNETPLLDVFALQDTHGGTLDAEEFGAAAGLPAIVLVGDNRRIVRDITEIVRGYLATPTSNHGLILGSLRGDRDGLFSVKTGKLEQGIVARLIIHHRDE